MNDLKITGQITRMESGHQYVDTLPRIIITTRYGVISFPTTEVHSYHLTQECLITINFGVAK